MLKKIQFIFEGEKKIYFYFLFLILFFISILETISIGLILPILNLLISKNKTNIKIIDDNLFNNSSEITESIIIFCIAVTSIFLIKNLLLAIFGWYKTKFTQNISRNLQIKLLKNYLNLPLSNFISTNSSLVMRNINGEPKMLLKHFIHPLFILLQDLAISFGLIILIFFNLSEFAIYILISFIIIISTFYLFTKKILKKFSEKRLKFVGQTLQFLRESIELIRDIKIYNKSNFFIKKYLNSTNKLNFVNLNISFIGMLPKLIIEIVIILIGLSVIFYSVFILNIDMITLIPSLALIGAAFLKLIPSIIRIINQYQKMEYAIPSIKIIYKILNETKNFINDTNIEKLEKFKNLELKNVSYSYDNKEIFNKINLKIFKGEIVVVQGESGEGKSTLLNIISGLIKPTKGEIYLNDKKQNFSSLPITKLSIVSSENYFLDASIAENIALKPFEEINIKEKNQIKFLLSLLNLSIYSEKLDFKIGERGNKLSDGQKQRFAIAKALFHKPELLIFDEATSAVDVGNENLLLQNIFENFEGITLLFVSHRDTSVFKKFRKINIKNKKIYD